ncbi:MAG: dicarboxylate/amino acid:cation symporter [Candidatus Melainabacteria bacterium HGW-Melainabacteria-1]|nr:MAG: dicarboxylate/amino acid:cation symporter [Candidatus Melainabacteria bacterium HGW-Melainabacteria-1]
MSQTITETQTRPKGRSLHTRIFIGMLVGIIAGIGVQLLGLPEEVVNSIVQWVKPIGDIFLRLLFMMVMPLILSALILGVAELGDLGHIGRIGLKTLIYTLLASGISVVVGISVYNLFQPGRGLSAPDREFLISRFSDQAGKVQQNLQAAQDKPPADIIVTLFSRNPIEDMARAFDPSHTGGGLLAVMVFALILGLALSASDPEKAQPVKRVLEGIYEMVMQAIGFGMVLAPFGVAALLFVLVATTGTAILMMTLNYVLVVLLALCIQQFLVYSLILKFIAGWSPLRFFRGISEVMITAFSTSSSNATLPTAIRVSVEKLGLPREVAHFVLTIGSTANQNGTALFEGITVLFLAQCFGVELSLAQQVLVVFLSILAGVGTAGVPGGSLPLIMGVLVSLGIPGESIAIIYGVDRILDMSRTVLNVTGDIVAVAVISRFEGHRPDQPQAETQPES